MGHAGEIIPAHRARQQLAHSLVNLAHLIHIRKAFPDAAVDLSQMVNMHVFRKLVRNRHIRE